MQNDKHTDALDLDRLELLATKSDPIYTDLYGDRYSQGSWSRADFDKEQDDFIGAFTPAVALQLIAKIRATEGQAQTSAAGFDRKGFIRQVVLAVCEIPDRDSPEDQPEMMLVTDYELGSILESCFEYADERAAQVADSTAPGAPVDESNRAGWFVYEGNCWVATSSDDPRATKLYRAAPPAQQSLTAGGAVPDANSEIVDDLAMLVRKLVRAVRNTNPNSELAEGAVGYLKRKGIAGSALRAAAPLPQVQSEALEAARYALRHAASLYACGFNVAHARSRTNGVDETGLSADEYETAADDVRTAIRKALDLVRSALKSDQQPVIPSGALADNDGGVA